jgi:hypothetical protein
MAVETSRAVALVVAPAPRSGRTTTACAAATLAVGAVSSSFVLPIGVAIVIGLLGFAGVITARWSGPRRRAARIARASRRARTERRRARERELGTTNLVARESLGELTKLVDDIESTAPEVATRFELEDLLDRHVSLALAHERSLRATGMFDRGELERARDALRVDPAADRLRVELCERRLHAHTQCQLRVDQLANELAVLADLIRLIAQQVACPDEPALDDRIERHLAELDEDDAVRRQLAEELD